MNHPLQAGAIILPVDREELTRLIRQGIDAALDERLPKQDEASSTSSTDLLSREETAELLHVSLSTLRKFEKSGQLVPCRIGRRVLYRADDVTAALERTKSMGRRK